MRSTVAANERVAAARAVLGAVYSKFGDMRTLLDAVYLRGFDILAGQMRDEGSEADPMGELERLGLGYRRFALANPALFALMFERPLPGFDPSPESRRDAIDATFGILHDAVIDAQATGLIPEGDPRRIGFLIWVGVHGISAIEATYTSRSQLDAWFIEGDADGVAAIRSIVRTVCAGLRSM